MDKKKIKTSLVLCLLVFSLFSFLTFSVPSVKADATPVTAISLFGDDFEGDLSQWAEWETGTGGYGSVVISEDWAVSGSQSVKIRGQSDGTHNGLASIYNETVFNIPSKNLWITNYCFVNDLDSLPYGDGFGNSLTPILFSPDDDVYFKVSLNGTGYWSLYDGSSWVESDLAFVWEEFVLFEVHVFIDDSVGYVELYVAGVKEAESTGLDTSSFSSIHYQFVNVRTKVGVEDASAYFDDYNLLYDPDVDETEPTYSSLSTSTTVAGASCNFNATFDDETALPSNGQYQFATNNTGAWVWDSAINFTSTPETVSVSKTLNASVGQVVGYRWNVTDNAGNLNYTATQTFVLTDETVPSYIGYASEAYAGLPCNFTAVFNDETALHPNGQYTFGTNNTGTWVYDSIVNFTSTPQTVTVWKTLNSSLDVYVERRWNFTDNAGNYYNLTTSGFSLTDGSSPTVSGVSHSQTGLGGQTIFSATATDATGLVGGGWIFSQNITGTWTNATYTAFTTNPESIQSIDTLGLQGNVVVGYRWYLNDTLGNSGSSSIYTLTTDDESLGGGGGGDDDTPPPDGDTVPFGGGGVGFDLPQLIDDIAEAIRNMPPWVLWGILGILGAVAVVGITNQQIGKETKRYVNAPLRKVEQELNPRKKKKDKKKPQRSKLKLFD